MTRGRRFLIVMLAPVFLMLGFAGVAFSDVFVSKDRRVSVAYICNNFTSEAALSKYLGHSRLNFERKLAPRECIEDSTILDGSLITPSYLLKSVSDADFISATEKNRNSFDWEKLLYLVVGALLSPLVGSLEFLLESIRNWFRLKLRIRHFKLRFARDLEKPIQALEFDDELQKFLRGEIPSVFFGSATIERVEGLLTLLERVKAGDESASKARELLKTI